MKKVILSIAILVNFNAFSQSQADLEMVIKKGIEWIEKGDQSGSVKSIKGLNTYLFQFMSAQKVIYNTKNSKYESVKLLSEDLSKKLTAKQIEEFPKLRKIAIFILRDELSESGTVVDGHHDLLVVESPTFGSRSDALELHYDKEFSFLYTALGFRNIVYASTIAPVNLTFKIETKGDTDLERYLQIN